MAAGNDAIFRNGGRKAAVFRMEMGLDQRRGGPLRNILLTAAWLGALSVGATAEDFSGFYAGLNAGYARSDGERDRRSPGTITGLTEVPASESALPPSARSASETMRARSRNEKPAR